MREVKQLREVIKRKVSLLSVVLLNSNFSITNFVFSERCNFYFACITLWFLHAILKTSRNFAKENSHNFELILTSIRFDTIRKQTWSQVRILTIMHLSKVIWTEFALRNSFLEACLPSDLIFPMCIILTRAKCLTSLNLRPGYLFYFCQK